MNFNDLTEEQKAKAAGCNTPEQMLELAKEEGYELSEEELAAVSGGSWGNNSGGSPAKCPKCGSTSVVSTLTGSEPILVECQCRNCGYEWTA